MKAMLYADWMNFRQSLRAVVLIMAFCLVWTAVTGEPMMFSIMLVSASYLFPNTVFNVEQTSGWNKLSLSMPVLRRDVVASRFLLSLAVNASMLACGLVFSAVFCMLVHTETTLAECIGAALGGEAVALVLLGCVLAALAVYAICYFISVRIYRKKEL